MKILIHNNQQEAAIFAVALAKYLRLREIYSEVKTAFGFILIDEKKKVIQTANDLIHLMDHVGWIGNVLVLSEKQFIEHSEKEQDKKEYPNSVGLIPQFVKDLFAGVQRDPCKYCGKTHPDYVCDAQLTHIKNQLNRPLSELKKICKGCKQNMLQCVCNEHEKECVDCP